MLPLVAKICSTNHSADKIVLNMDFFFFFLNENKPQTTQPVQEESKVNSSHIRFKLLYLCYRTLIIGAKIFLLGNFISFVFPFSI